MWIFTRQKKSNSNEKMLFRRKTDETVWKPPLSKKTPPSPPPPAILTNPLFLINFFMTPLFVQISKTRTLLLILEKTSWNRRLNPENTKYRENWERRRYRKLDRYCKACKCRTKYSDKNLFISTLGANHVRLI